MRDDLDKKLCEDFPLLYRDRHGDSSKTCMVQGFPGDGWEPLIRRLSEKLEAAIESFPKCLPLEGPPCASQVKEKFGALRFYMTWFVDEFDEWIAEAEAESRRTCEECGATGKLTGKGWVKTACPEHAR